MRNKVLTWSVIRLSRLHFSLVLERTGNVVELVTGLREEGWDAPYVSQGMGKVALVAPPAIVNEEPFAKFSRCLCHH